MNEGVNAVYTLDDVKLVNETVQQTDPTCCRLYDVCSVSQAHEIKLVETPGLLVSRLHRVLPPLVNHLISWVSICNYTEHVCMCVCVCDPWRYTAHPNDGYPVQTDLGPARATFVLWWRLANEKADWSEDGGRRKSRLNDSFGSIMHWIHLDAAPDLHMMLTEPGSAFTIDHVRLMMG